MLILEFDEEDEEDDEVTEFLVKGGDETGQKQVCSKAALLLSIMTRTKR